MQETEDSSKMIATYWPGTFDNATKLRYQFLLGPNRSGRRQPVIDVHRQK